MKYPDKSGGYSYLRTFAACVGLIALTAGCGASREDSQSSLDKVVHADGYKVLDRGQNQMGGMIFDRVAVGPGCTADVWSPSNDADLVGSVDWQPLIVKVHTNPELGENEVTVFEADKHSLPTLGQLLDRPVVAHSCPAA